MNDDSGESHLFVIDSVQMSLSSALDEDDCFLSPRLDLSFSNQSWRFHLAQRSVIPLKSEPIHSNETNLFGQDLREIKSRKVFGRWRWLSRHDRSNSQENRRCIFYFVLCLFLSFDSYWFRDHRSSETSRSEEREKKGGNGKHARGERRKSTDLTRRRHFEKSLFTQVCLE